MIVLCLCCASYPMWLASPSASLAPAPEGWDKDITPATQLTLITLMYNLSTPRGLHPSHLYHPDAHRYSLCLLVYTPDVLILCAACSYRLSPPAPEGWDKDNTRNQHITLRGNSSPLTSIPSSPFVLYMIPFSSCCAYVMLIRRSLWPSCVLSRSLAPGPGGLG